MGVKQIWIDCETTGLDPKTDTIIELAAECDGDIFHAYCLPDTKPNNWDFISNLTGITAEFLFQFGTTESALYKKFNEWICKKIDRYDKTDKAVLCGYGARFDMDFIRALFDRNNDKYFGSFFFSLPMDVQSLVAQGLLIGIVPILENMKLETVCNHFNIGIDAHSALSDIISTRRLFNKLTEK